jgi:Glutathione-dependent formaldehyde-activating enzyme
VRGGALSAKGLALGGLQLPLQGLPAFLRSGMVHVAMIVRDEDFEVLSDQTVRYDRKANSGNVIAMNFCAHCHGWLWNALPGIGTLLRACARVEMIREFPLI